MRDSTPVYTVLSQGVLQLQALEPRVVVSASRTAVCI